MANQEHIGVPLTVTDESFEERVLGYKDGPAVLMMWAPWCGPCQAMMPVFKEMAVTNSTESNAQFFTLDVDDYPKTAMRHDIRTIPHFLIFNKGDVAETINGAVHSKVLQESIDNAVRQFASSVKAKPISAAPRHGD